MNLSENIWLDYHARLRAFILSRISDSSASDEILQEVFLKMHTGLASLKDETKLKSWLYRITRNAMIDYFRAHRSTAELPDMLEQPETDSGEKVAQELSQCLQPMIQKLPESCREAIILSELKGFSQKDVARMQGISLSGTKSRVQRGRARLKETLADCCRLEFDRGGRLSGYEPEGGSCDECR